MEDKDQDPTSTMNVWDNNGFNNGDVYLSQNGANGGDDDINLDQNDSTAEAHPICQNGAGIECDAALFWKNKYEQIINGNNRGVVSANYLQADNVRLVHRLNHAEKSTRDCQQKLLKALDQMEPVKKELNEQKDQLLIEIREKSKFESEVAGCRATIDQLNTFIKKYEEELSKLRHDSFNFQVKESGYLNETKKAQERMTILHAKYKKLKADMKAIENENMELKKAFDNGGTFASANLEEQQNRHDDNEINDGGDDRDPNMVDDQFNSADRGDDRMEIIVNDQIIGGGYDQDPNMIDALLNLADHVKNIESDQIEDGDNNQASNMVDDQFNLADRSDDHMDGDPINDGGVENNNTTDDSDNVDRLDVVEPLGDGREIVKVKIDEKEEGVRIEHIRYINTKSPEEISNSVPVYNAEHSIDLEIMPIEDHQENMGNLNSVSDEDDNNLVIAENADTEISPNEETNAIENKEDIPEATSPITNEDKAVESDSDIEESIDQEKEVREDENMEPANEEQDESKENEKVETSYFVEESGESLSMPIILTSKDRQEPISHMEDASTDDLHIDEAVSRQKGASETTLSESSQNESIKTNRSIDEAILSVIRQRGESETTQTESSQDESITKTKTRRGRGPAKKKILLNPAEAGPIGRLKRRLSSIIDSSSECSSRPSKRRRTSKKNEVVSIGQDTNLTCRKTASVNFKPSRPYSTILNCLLKSAGLNSQRASLDKWHKLPKAPPETMAFCFIEAVISEHIAVPWVEVQLRSLEQTESTRVLMRNLTKTLNKRVQSLPSNDKKLANFLAIYLSEIHELETIPEIMLNEVKIKLAATDIDPKLNDVQIEAICRWAFYSCQKRASENSLKHAKEILLIILRRGDGDFIEQGKEEYFRGLLNVFMTLAVAWPRAFKRIMVDARSELEQILQTIFRRILWNSDSKSKYEHFMEQCIGHLTSVLPFEEQPNYDNIIEMQTNRLWNMKSSYEIGGTGIQPPIEFTKSTNKLLLMAPFFENEISSVVNAAINLVIEWPTMSTDEPTKNGGIKRLITDILLLMKMATFYQTAILNRYENLVSSLKSMITDTTTTTTDRLFISCAIMDLLTNISPLLSDGIDSAQDLLKECLETVKGDTRAMLAVEYYENRLTKLCN